MNAKQKNTADVFSLEGIPSLQKAISLSLQHILAAVGSAVYLSRVYIFTAFADF
ncbi:MAG: hypothetical protein RSE27_07275 [Ruthenibacterium sp.]